MTNGIRKGYVSRDSLEACDPQADLYYTIRNPNAPARPAPSAPIQKDTLENLQKKLEQEARLQLLLGNRGAASEKVQLAANIAKYLFMAFMLPPYLIVYALPKFFLTKALPKALKVLFKPINRTLQALADIAATMKLRLEKLASFFKVSKGEQTKSEGRTLFQRMTDPFVAFYMKSKAAVLAPFRLMRRTYIRSVSAVKGFINDQVKRVKSAIKGAVNASKLYLFSQFERLGNLLHRTFVQPVADWTTPKVQAVKDVFSALSRQVADAVQKIRDSVIAFTKNPLQAIAQIANGAVQWLATVANNISAPAVEWVKLRVGEVASIGREWRSQAYDLVADRYELAKEQVREWANTSTQAVKQAANILWNGVVHLPQQLARIVPKVSFEWLRKGGRWGGNKYRQVKESFQTSFQKAAASLKEGVRRGCGELKKIMAAWALKLWAHLRALPYQLWLLSKVIGKQLLVGAKKAVYGVRVGLAWSKVLFKYGMQLVREAAQEFTSSVAAWMRS